MGLNLVLYTLGSFFKSKQMNKVMTRHLWKLQKKLS